jgi:hypothetical protein
VRDVEEEVAGGVESITLALGIFLGISYVVRCLRGAANYHDLHFGCYLRGVIEIIASADFALEFRRPD